MKKTLLLSLLCLGWAGAPAAWAAPTRPELALRQGDDTPAKGDADPKKDPERLEAWPTPDKDQAKLLKTELARLRKASTPEMAVGGREGLIGLGDVAGPALLTALGKEKSEDARERLVDVLTEITGARHTRLLAENFGDRSDDVRLFALRRAACFPDAGVLPAAMAAFEAAKKRVDTKQEVRHELYCTALVVTSSGTLDGLPMLHAEALEHWGDSGQAIRAAIEAIRGPEATALVAKELEGGDRKAIVAALRLLAGCGDAESAKGIVGPYLDETDNTIRVAAINALRGIVDGDPPLDRLPVFEAVELAGKWKTRL